MIITGIGIILGGDLQKRIEEKLKGVSSYKPYFMNTHLHSHHPLFAPGFETLHISALDEMFAGLSCSLGFFPFIMQ